MSAVIEIALAPAIPKMRAWMVRQLMSQSDLAGYADIVDDQYVYELKHDGGDLACAVGQAVLYAAALKRKPCVVTVSPSRVGQREAAELAGIAVEVFR